MARVAFPLVLQSPVTGSALVGATATITKHVVGASLGSGAEAEIFDSDTESTKVSGNKIVTDNTGRWTQGEAAIPAYAQYWLPEGTYDILISGAGLKSVYITRELVSGNSVVAVESGATKSFLSWGVVSASGAVEAGTGDYTVAKLGSGEYEVKWTVAKTSAHYAVNATASGGIGTAVAVLIPAVRSKGTVGFVLQFLSPAEALKSTEFHFIALAGA